MSKKEKAIGVFDSGLGGISVLRELKARMPKERYIYYGDSSFAPYGEKSRPEIRQRCEEICAFFVKQGVKAIVIACNTATSACVKELRKEYAELPIIGMEPALKVAVDGRKQQRVLVLATRFTLREKKFEELLRCYGAHHTIYRQPCPKLVELVEQDRLQQKELVRHVLEEYLSPYREKGIDSIVLGCTHFVFFRKEIEAVYGKPVEIIDGNQGTVRHVQEVLRLRDALCDKDEQGSVQIYNSLNSTSVCELSEKLLYTAVES